MGLPDIHARLALSFILFMAIATVWNLAAAARRRGVNGTAFGILAVGELLALAQGLLGVVLYLGGERPARPLHLIYGATAVLTLPAYYAISKGRDDPRASLVYGLLCLFLAGIGYRAIVTGA